jgi:hypothetical protein
MAVRVDRIDGPFPGVAVGDELDATGDGQVGEQLFFAQLASETSKPSGTDVQLYQATRLLIRDGAVYCQVNPDTAKRPVTIDTAIDALRAPSGLCVEVLASDDSLWNRSQCEGGSGRGGIDVGSEGGCNLGVTPTAGLSSVVLTSAAVFAALVARRRQARDPR